MSSVETHDYNLSIWAAEARASGASGQPELLSKLEACLSRSDSVSDPHPMIRMQAQAPRREPLVPPYARA